MELSPTDPYSGLAPSSWVLESSFERQIEPNHLANDPYFDLILELLLGIEQKALINVTAPVGSSKQGVIFEVLRAFHLTDIPIIDAEVFPLESRESYSASHSPSIWYSTEPLYPENARYTTSMGRVHHIALNPEIVVDYSIWGPVFKKKLKKAVSYFDLTKLEGKYAPPPPLDAGKSGMAL